jgi:hypothetical protein
VGLIAREERGKKQNIKDLISLENAFKGKKVHQPISNVGVISYRTHHEPLILPFSISLCWQVKSMDRWIMQICKMCSIYVM